MKIQNLSSLGMRSWGNDGVSSAASGRRFSRALQCGVAQLVCWFAEYRMLKFAAFRCKYGVVALIFSIHGGTVPTAQPFPAGFGTKV